LITVYGFGPFLGTPDSSPFVIKVMVLLRMAGLPFTVVRGNPLNAPRKLLPYIEDGGVRVADSTMIRRHLETKYGIDFDAGLSREQKGLAWAVERMCEDHLYFAILDLRWIDTSNFEKGLGRHMFGHIPAPIRPLAKAMLRRMNAKRLQGHGLGRHARPEIADLAIRDLESLSALLGEKPFMTGDAPSAADASVFGIITAILIPSLASPVCAALRGHANLVAYQSRLAGQHFGELSVARAA
jgi:glutathione S-transferase